MPDMELVSPAKLSAVDRENPCCCDTLDVGLRDRIMEGLMSEMVPFQIAPNLFNVVEFGRVFWQLLVSLKSCLVSGPNQKTRQQVI
jgi:hypothetical protein